MIAPPRRVLALLVLCGCTGSDIIDPVEEQLASRVVDAASLPIRLSTAVAGVIAASCSGDDYQDAATSTSAGEALGLPSGGPQVVEDGATTTWEWVDVGLDDVTGRLAIERNATGTQYDVVFQAADSARTLQVSYLMVYCAESTAQGPSAARRADPAAPVALPLSFAPPPAAGSDDDGDGYTTPEDCDDDNAAIHPGATEIWYDGINQNCDREDDFDQDADGHAALAYAEAYASYTPPGTPLEADDCDDLERTVHPGAAEVAGDGIDQDCDGADAGAVAVLSATGVWVGEGEDATAQIDLKGSPPYAGLEFAPNTAGTPTGGYVTWNRPSTGDSIQMQDASAIADGAWPGTATAEDWEREITIAVP